MPYITQAARDRIDGGRPPSTPGELNYAISKLLKRYVSDKPSYALFAEAISACEAAKMEFYRRVVAPYEDMKIAMHGDIY